ncbi:MAG TPA: prolipoprotein diacylglyceryl transferase [Gemmatimonadales bacterium]|nr:prolipoprotein diacylglyceryl transferase [Gemmatimonadales bacterium]
MIPRTVYPLNLHVGPLNITGYGVMMMVGFLMGGWLMDRELRRRGWNHDYAADMTVAAVIGGILGAKLWYVVATHDLGALFSRGGLVWYGGFLGGVAAVLLNSARLKVPLRWTLDLTAPALPAAYALGRIGCFLVGDDYGRPTTLPWGVKFPQGLPPTTADALSREFGVTMAPGTPPDTVLAVHPTQLYEAVLMIGLFMVLWRLRGNRHATGWLFSIYLMLAGAERFLIEFVRAKEDHLAGGITVAQVVAIGLMVSGAVLYAKWKEGTPLEPGEYLRTVKK